MTENDNQTTIANLNAQPTPNVVNSNVENNDYKELDDYINDLNSNYTKFENERSNLQRKNIGINFLRNSFISKLPGISGFVNPFLESFESKYADTVSKRDKYFELLNDAKAKKIELLTNIRAQKNRYINERQALASVGVNNPFFMLKNGVLGAANSPSLTGGNFASNLGNQDKLTAKPWKSEIDRLKEFLLFLKLLKDVKR